MELLVAVAVLAVLSVGATLSLRPQGGASDMARFMAAFEMQQALAISERARRGLILTPKGIQVARWQRDPSQGDGWRAEGQLRRWHGKVSVTSQSPAAFGVPQVVILPTGQTSRFAVVFAKTRNGGGRCAADGWSGMTCVPG